AKALTEAGLPTWVGGNIGTPLIEQALVIPRDAVVVLELSSFQLQSLDVSPDIGVVLNVTPNHLDYHASMEEYAAAKSRVFANQPGRGSRGGPRWAVLNRDNPFTRAMRDLDRPTLFENRLSFRLLDVRRGDETDPRPGFTFGHTADRASATTTAPHAPIATASSERAWNKLRRTSSSSQRAEERTSGCAT
ncbi:MAG: hypothetical protein K6T27_07940, partial [Thermoleophilum sp.]|nr:hypothetical protein [Thermoleophilum sp.]